MTSSISGIGGGLSASDLKKMQEQMFKSADKNGDGTISKDELSQMAPADNDRNGPSVDDMFSQMDTDGNGAISRLESDAAIAKAGQQMQAQGPPPPPPGNSDSSSSDSTSTDTTTVYDAMDTNKDGKVSASELAAALAKLGGSSSASTSSDPKTLLDNLSTALQSGNVSDAKSALSALQKDVASHNGGSSDDPFSKDLQSLSDALESGSMSDAQGIFANIQDKLASGPPKDGNVQSAEASGSSSTDTVAQTLQALLDALDKSSSATGSTTDSGNSLKEILAAALKSYTQQSSSGYAQGTASSSLSATA